MHCTPPPQIRQFQPKMVAIRDASQLPLLKELIKDVPLQPEILVGDEGAVEVRVREMVVCLRHGCVWGAWVDPLLKKLIKVDT